jgi:hypothetical protein
MNPPGGIGFNLVENFRNRNPRWKNRENMNVIYRAID